ncbi:Glycosyl hydrolase superfamily protein [Theobroma cacao]|uniref:glucan endo-1,3-beta-D-glucosidase n=2 Tax=Theobroma cacao TaxID=3641 RepID=A0A061EPY8_THECC|nr:Glycosyl hydrolase superfamily protein [Theobroma cacao]
MIMNCSINESRPEIISLFHMAFNLGKYIHMQCVFYIKSLMVWGNQKHSPSDLIYFSMATFPSASNSSFMAAIILLLGLFAANLDITGAESVGVCYGMLGNNLPSAWEVIELYKSRNIRRMRLYDPNPAALQALRGSNIEVMLGVPNSDLQNLANPSNAQSWVQRNVVSYWPSVRFRYIAVGNEVSPVNGGTAWLAQFVLPALVNVFNAVRSAGLHNDIKVSIAIDMTLIGNSYPPSAGAFRGDVRSYLDPIIGHLAWASTPLLANIYPYFSHAGNPRDISLPYALFTSPSPVAWDQGRGYQNLFDAMLDALYSALENAGQPSLGVVVSESGWPSAGGFATSVENAQTYLSKLIGHVQGGTPKRPGRAIETYLFALFDENQKEPELEKHFGLFSPNKQPKYPLSFGGGRILDVSAEYNATISLKSDM